jgi:hypothetical protein
VIPAEIALPLVENGPGAFAVPNRGWQNLRAIASFEPLCSPERNFFKQQ